MYDFGSLWACDEFVIFDLIPQIREITTLDFGRAWVWYCDAT